MTSIISVIIPLIISREDCRDAGIAGAMIPEEKWYTNLYTRGNTGCAAMPIMIDDF